MKRAHQAGMSLIELMISLLLSSFLILGILQLFINSNSTDKANSALARLQENGRIALDLLKQDLRRTSYQGCAMPSAESRANSSSSFPLDAMGAPSQDDSPTDDESHEGNGTDSDKLVVRYARPVTMRATNISASSVTFITSNNINFTAGDRYEFILTNCHEVAIFTGIASARSNNTDATTNAAMPDKYSITSLQGLNAGAPPNLNGFPTGLGSQFLTIGENNFVVQPDPSNLDAQGNGISTLYKNGDPLIAGVDNFQVLYGVESGGVTRWINADNLDDNTRSTISRLQISIVMASETDVTDQTNTQALPIANIGADTSLAATADRRLRRVFNSVIDVRNRP
ncbi:type IV pilus assembly protein PilW [Pseudomonas fluvialis]|uniref:Type IV pilus assembly protein PilW n=1 Tax=Pseudomonas fluvialis TaxID=1793966 RepID=A0A7X0BTK1_9PSED|nr:PilW family protein [Pseudomonas fluvialis]MBB6342397.1 type IV pilus assembly protein PilW [Pseudomonas fluvialis]